MGTDLRLPIPQHPCPRCAQSVPRDDDVVNLITNVMHAARSIVLQETGDGRILAKRLKHPIPNNFEAITHLLQVAEKAASIPVLEGLDIHHSDWATVDLEAVEAAAALVGDAGEERGKGRSDDFAGFVHPVAPRENANLAWGRGE